MYSLSAIRQIELAIIHGMLKLNNGYWNAASNKFGHIVSTTIELTYIYG